MHRSGLALSIALLALAVPSSAVETLTSDDVLVVEFTITPPYECRGGTICTPDLLEFSSGPRQVLEFVNERRTRVYVDGVLLGTHVEHALSPTPGFTGPLLDGFYRDTGSPFTLADPTPIDFAPIVAGSSDARIELRLGSGSVHYMDGFPEVLNRLSLSTSPTTKISVVNGPVITSMQIIKDPEKFRIVNSTADDPDAAPGDGRCETALGDCTLPAAVQEANAFPGTDQITVPAGSYPGVLTISESVEITGAGAGRTAIDGGGSGTVLTISDGNIELQGLSVTGGLSAGDGGGIALQGGTLVLVGVKVHGNGAAGNGGGIHQANDTFLVATDCAIHHNTAGSSGGGIFATGSLSDLQLETSSVHHNTAESGDGGGIRSSTDLLLLEKVEVHDNDAQRGGGLVSDDFFAFVVDVHAHGNTDIDWAGGAVFRGFELTLGGSTFEDNHSTSGAGALRVAGVPFADFYSSTVSGNSGQSGGGILLESPFTAVLKNLTVTANQADTGGGLLLSSVSGSGSLDIDNTILAANSATGVGPDCASVGGLVSLASLGHNLVGDGSGCAFPATTGDQVGSAMSPIDPLLAPLGGPPYLPPVHDLLPGSPAIDRGSPEVPDSSPSACLAEDQRYAPRPFDGDGDGTARCDIGAVETGSVRVPVLGPAGLVALCLLLGAAGAANRP